MLATWGVEGLEKVHWDLIREGLPFKMTLGPVLTSRGRFHHKTISH